MGELFLCLGRCGRMLRAETSLARKYGPDCRQKLHGPPAPALRIASPTSGQIDGQTALNLIYHQPTLGSI